MAVRQEIHAQLTDQLNVAANGNCSGSRCATDFAPTNGHDKELAQGILDSPKVRSQMERSWERTFHDGKYYNERGFWIYKNTSNGFFAGKETVGSKINIQLGNPLTAMGTLMEHGVAGLAVARFHTHPGSYPDAARPTVGDLNWATYLMFIYTYKGIIWGRN